jgi:hypothetical protein
MKRLSFVIAALIVAGSTAQPAAGQWRSEGLVVGASAGATYSKLTGDYIVSSDWTTGFAGGLYLDYRYTPTVSLRLEANYVQEGTKGAVTTAADSLDVDLAYLQLPLLFNFVITVSNRFGLLLFTGAALNINLTCDIKEAGAPSTSCGAGTPFPEARKTEFSSPLGVALGFKLSDSINLLLDGRYDLAWSSNFETVEARTNAWIALVRGEFRI